MFKKQVSAFMYLKTPRRKVHINNYILLFEFQLLLMPDLLLQKINQHQLIDQSQEFTHAVLSESGT